VLDIIGITLLKILLTCVISVFNTRSEAVFFEPFDRPLLRFGGGFNGNNVR
jgi:hypothetical protein